MPGQLAQAPQSLKERDVILLGLESGHHDQASGRMPRFRPQVGGNIWHPIMDRHDSVLSHQSGIYAKPAIELRDSNNLACERADGSFQPTGCSRLHRRCPGGAGPAVDRDYQWNAKDPGSEAAEDPDLGAMGGD